MTEQHHNLINTRPGNTFERHYRVKELSILWGISPETVTRLFSREPGVLRVDNANRGKRKYTVLCIPESVAERVHGRLSQTSEDALQTTLPTGNPLRVIHFRDFDRTVTKKPRHVLKLNPGKELADRKRVA